MNGDGGNDTLVWNNGDASDRIVGGDGNDTTEVNGSSTLGDVFVLDPEPGGVKFQRTNLVAFTLDTATEHVQVNGLGGNDSVTAHDGVGAATLLSVDGGAGDDTVNGSDGPDLILGGEGNDALNGGGGDDRIVGDRGADTMNGGSGDDTLVWNNGDGSDVINGDGGSDDVEVNGSPTAGDVFTVQPNGARIKFDRTNLVPFTLDIGSSETMHANGLGGDDTIGVGNVGNLAVTARAGRATTRSAAATRQRRSSAGPATTPSRPAAASTSSSATMATTGSTSATRPLTWPLAAPGTTRSSPTAAASTSSRASRPSTARRCLTATTARRSSVVPGTARGTDAHSGTVSPDRSGLVPSRGGAASGQERRRMESTGRRLSSKAFRASTIRQHWSSDAGDVWPPGGWDGPVAARLRGGSKRET